jgi:hypothetical protein
MDQEQRQRLSSHLVKIFDDVEYVTFVVDEIERDLQDVGQEPVKGQRKPHALDPCLKAVQAKLARHHTLGSNHRRLAESDYNSTIAQLHYLLLVVGKADKRGRPEKTERTELIRRLSDYFPDRISRKSKGGDFALTVKMVLEIGGFSIPNDKSAELENLHGMILDALRGIDGPTLRSEVLRATWRTK